MRNPHAGVPFDTPDDQIAAALRDVSIPTLMLSMLHMTGDADLIRGELRPAGLFLNEVQGFMSEEDKDAVRARALEVIKDYRDRGCPEPEPLSEELVHEMMEWLVVEDVGVEYGPMMATVIVQGIRDVVGGWPLGLVAGVMPILAVSWGLGEMLRAAWRSPDKRTLWDRAGGTMVRYRRGAPSGWGTAP